MNSQVRSDTLKRKNIRTEEMQIINAVKEAQKMAAVTDEKKKKAPTAKDRYSSFPLFVLLCHERFAQ